jgi:FkbM family methyltransferase
MSTFLDVDFLRSMGKGSVHTMVQTVLQAGQVAVDVGAAEGEICATMRQCVGPTGKVIAIEPRVTEIPTADVIHGVACGDTPGTRPFYLTKPLSGSSCYKAAAAVMHATDRTDVPVARLDDLVEYADLVKIDVQGGELDVLEGAPKLLTVCPAWILEVWPYGLMAAGASMESLWSRLRDAGLFVYDVDGRFVSWERTARWVLGLRTPLSHANWLCRRA